MKLSRKSWNNYVRTLSGINKTAGRKMQAWIDRHGTDDVDALVEYAYALTSRYGEAASAVACEMYDEIATAQKASVQPAVPKPTQNFKYVNKAVRSTLERAPSTVPNTVGELVKRTGAETTLKNALRDGAYFAWVPHGDTCPFCITLASNGWRRASKKTIKGDHAEHIHQNCDCEFAISFNGPGDIEGYDPDKYLDMYENAEGDNWKDKVNSMRRADYAANRDAINAQKRAAYANRINVNINLDGDGGYGYNNSPIEEIRELPKQLLFTFCGVPEFIPNHAVIEEPLTIAGKGTKKRLRIAKVLAEKYKKYESNPDEWKKMVGKIRSDKYLFDIHWYECDDKIVRDPKIKHMKERK